MVELCIFNGIGDVSDLPGATFPLSESFLGIGESIVCFYIVCKSPGEESSPDLVKTVSHGDGSVVTKVGWIPFFVEEDCGATAPALWSVMVLKKCLAVQVEEMVCSGGRPFDGFIG